MNRLALRPPPHLLLRLFPDVPLPFAISLLQIIEDFVVGGEWDADRAKGTGVYRRLPLCLNGLALPIKI